jgi:hypothetical protein
MHDSREISVNAEGRPLFGVLIGAEEFGKVIVSTNPRITEVKIREASNSIRSCSSSSERNFTRGPIMYEFHKNDSSRLSMSNDVDSADLAQGLALVGRRMLHPRHTDLEAYLSGRNLNYSRSFHCSASLSNRHMDAL